MRVLQNARILLLTAREEHHLVDLRTRPLEFLTQLLEGINDNVAHTVDVQDAFHCTTHLRLGHKIGLHLIPGHHLTAGGLPSAVVQPHRDETISLLFSRLVHVSNLDSAAMVLSTGTALSVCPACVAAITLPLALFLLLAETAVGGAATVVYLRLSAGLTRGFLKFISVTYATVGLLAFLTVLAGPPGAYHDRLGVDKTAGGTLVFLQGLVLLALLAHVVLVFRGSGSSRSWLFTLGSSLLLLIGIVLALAPLASSGLGVAAIALGVLLSATVLGAATTGMLLGHWYLVTPALSNRPLLRSIVALLVGLLLQALVYPLMLRGLAHSSGPLTHPLSISPQLSVLWVLGAVILPLIAAGLALPTCRLRSFTSTTGLLYLAMIALLPGQLVGQLLFFVAASA